MKLIMEKWRCFKEAFSREIPKLRPMGSEDPVLMGFGQYAKDRPRPRRTISLRPESIHQGILYLNMNLDRLTADMERNPDYPLEKKKTVERLIMNAYQTLEADMSNLESARLPPEEVARLDKKMEAVRQRIRQNIEGSETLVVDKEDPKAIEDSETIDKKD